MYSCRGHFYQFGEIRTITVVQRQQCAFIQFATRQAAEMAAEKSFNKLILNGRRLTVKWGRYDDSWLLRRPCCHLLVKRQMFLKEQEPFKLPWGEATIGVTSVGKRLSVAFKKWLLETQQELNCSTQVLPIWEIFCHLFFCLSSQSKFKPVCLLGLKQREEKMVSKMMSLVSDWILYLDFLEVSLLSQGGSVFYVCAHAVQVRGVGAPLWGQIIFP